MININNNNNTIKLSESDREFVNLVVNRITMYGQIPYTIPELLIIDMIKNSAKYFYKYYSNAWQKNHYYIKTYDLVNNDKNRESGTLNNITARLSPRIRIVTEVHETNMPSAQTATSLDVSTFGGSSTNGPVGINNNLYMIEKATQMVEANVFKQIFRSKIPFDYNHATQTLSLFREPTPGSNIILAVLCDIDIYHLYNDNFFERHVIAQCKRELKRLLGGHVFDLPGGVTMNAEEICNNIEDAEKVEELIKNGSGVGDIIMKR